MNLIKRWRQRSAVIGIEIGPEGVCLLQLAREGADIRVSHHTYEPLPPGAVVERQVADFQAVGEAIACARVRSGSFARSAVVALAAPAAVLRLLVMPAGLDEVDLEAQLELEATRILPASNGPPDLDFKVLGPIPDAPDRVQVLLALAHPVAVRQCVAALKYAGLRAVAVDVEALALARALAELEPQTRPPEQLITLDRHTVAVPDLTHLLAGYPDSDAGASSLLLAYGLALRGMCS